MKVWVLIGEWGDCESQSIDHAVVGVFTTKELAEEKAAQLKTNNRYDSFDIEEFDLDK